MKKKSLFTSLLFVAVTAAVLFYAFRYDRDVAAYKDDNPEPFALVDPEEAPEPKREQVMQGFRIMQQTLKYAPEYAGDKISCNNCHFDGGNSFGGKNNGISLVGVSQKYPVFSKRANRKIDLAERIGNCFRRSMDGKKPPASSPVIENLIAYFDWIATPVPEGSDLFWLGLKPVRIKKMGDGERGEELYNEHCAICHGKDGRGSISEEGNRIPPLWGESAFNDGAGMNRPEIFASFIYWNMPLGDPYLTESQAVDIAAYVTKQPRPHFIEQQ